MYRDDMSAQPSEPADPYSALELRVAGLEHQIRNIFPAKVDAVAYGVSLVHADTQAIRQELGEIRGDVHEARQIADGHTSVLAGLSAAVQEILRRLPEPPAPGTLSS